MKLLVPVKRPALAVDDISFAHVSLSLLLVLLPLASLDVGQAAGQSSNAASARFEGRYFGQEPPGMVPEVFAPDILSKTQPEWAFCAEFSPDHDEFYFSSTDLDRQIDQILVMKLKNDFWSYPGPASFNSPYNTHDSRISPDGQWIFFRSRRPLPGNDAPEESHIAWFAERQGVGWSRPQVVECGGVPLRTGHLGVSANGLLLFSLRSDNNVGEGDIHRSYFNDGVCSVPENLGPGFNTVFHEGDAFVAPDERYMIVSVWDHPQNNGDSDLYISYRNADLSWSRPKNLGEPINTRRNENCATLSPDGKYFFYVSVDTQDESAKVDTYWVDARILERYRSSYIP